MARIGPSFRDELQAGGVLDFRISFNTETGVIEFHPDVPDAERKKVEAVLAAHNPATPDPKQAERDGQAALAADAQADAVFAQLKSATPAQIATFVNTAFSTFTVQQRAVIKLLLEVAALVVRRG